MDVFEALSDPVRRDLLVQLAVSPARVVDLARSHPVSRPAISRHLRLLAEAGLVDAESRGRERHYEIRQEPLAEVEAFVASLRPSRPPITNGHLDALETEVHRTVRDRRRTSTGSTTSTTSTTTEQSA